MLQGKGGSKKPETKGSKQMGLGQSILVFIGLSAGFLVAAGVFSFAVMVGVVSRIVARTKTIRHLMLVEDCIVAGGTLGSLVSIYQPDLPFGMWFLVLFGIFSGIHAGCLAIALAEVVNVIPVFVRRVRLKVGLAYIITAFALGKAFGALWEMVLNVH